MKYHYVYRITNTKESKHYYGTRTSKCLPCEDLGITYFSSSKDKDFIQDQKTNLKDYKYKIIKTFSTRKEALKLEIKLHDRFDVGVNESFYNRAKQTSTGWDTTGTKWSMSERGRDNVRKAAKERRSYLGKGNPRYGAVLLEETKNKISETLKNNGYTDSLETRIKKSQSAKNRPPVTNETRQKISQIHKGKIVSQETIQKMIKTKESKDYGPNYNSLMVNIYDQNMNLKFECFGDFNRICSKNGLPHSALRKSLETKKPIYLNLNPGNLSKIEKSGKIKYKGWIAIYR